MGLRLRYRGLQTLDVLVYSVVVSALAILVGMLISFPFGWGWIGVKNWLFVAGWILIGFATLKLRPKSAWKQQKREINRRQAAEKDGPDETAVRRGGIANLGGFADTGAQRDDGRDDLDEKQAPVTRLGLRLLPEEYVLDDDDRLHGGARLFIASVGVLLVSIVMEFGFGIY